MRRIKYSQAIREGFAQAMEADPAIIQIGVGVNSPFYVGQSLVGLYDRFGEERMMDTPVSENGVMGMAVGAAMTGLRPIVTFARMDFMYYAMDQICNHAALLSYSLGGSLPMPLIIRAIINRGGEQGAQHSQALQSIFMHIPGLKVVMPAIPFDAKGMLVAAARQSAPILYIDDRWLYDIEGEVPEEMYEAPLTGARVLREGNDLTLVSSSFMTKESAAAVSMLAEREFSVEHIDLRSIKPLDTDCILRSVRKTHRLAIVDGTWKTGGVAAEIAAIAASDDKGALCAPVLRITLPDHPAPAASTLEAGYYPNAASIVRAVGNILKQR